MSNISQNNPKASKLKGKKILYLITQTKWGGAQKYVIDLAKHFAKNNEVHIAYGEPKQVDKRFLEQCQALNIKTIPITYLYRKIDISRDYLAVTDILKIFNQGAYNLVHLNSSKAGLLGALAAKMYSANPLNLKMHLVYTAHGFVFNEPLSKFRKNIYKFSERISTGIQHLVIAVSDADRQSAIDNKITYPEKIFTVHNGIDATQYNFYEADKAKNKLKLPNNKKYFGTIASFYKTKGYEFLVEAIKMLKQEESTLLESHQWVFIGDGPELDNIKQQVKENQLDNNVIFKQSDEGWKYLKAFDAFILPSVKEGLPYTILEAGLAGIPIIASKVGGVAEVIVNEKTGLLTTPANPLSLLKAMQQITDNNLVQNLVDNNYKNIQNNFSLNKNLQETERLYLKLF